jgi:type 2 lantibiotic biosynthesis protein LanM
MRNIEFSAGRQALSLRERLLSQERERRALVVNVEKGERRLDRWCAQPPFDTGDFFQQRLATDGLTRDDLAALLGEVGVSDVEGHTQRPPWVAALAESFSPPAAGQPRLGLPSQWQTLAGHEFWDFVEPIIRSPLRRLAREVEELRGQQASTPVRTDGLEFLLLNTLPRELLTWPLRTMVLELNVARLQGELKGSDPRSRFQEFIGRLRDPEIALKLLTEYPVLARGLAECVATWRLTTLELFERLCRDWPLIARTFTGCSAGDVLVNVQTGAGDRHRSGHTVAILSFQSGFRLVYKPRPLAIDALFQSLLGTLNTWGSEPAFRTVEVLARDGHGWIEYVTAQECDSPAAARCFYLRQGGYLALLYLLRASDIHFENVIAAGEHPAIVDLESLLHPGPAHDDPLANDSLMESIVRIGLLPIRNWENESSPGLDVSGLGGPDGQLPPRPEPYWANHATDQMHFARRQQQITASNKHRPTLAAQPLLALDYLDEIVAGFKSMYQLLLAHRDELLADGGPLTRFAQQEVRVLLRATSVYGLMLRESCHPDFLRDGLDRDRFFDKLWLQVPQRPFLQRVIRAEQIALWRGDIPLFTTFPDSRALRSCTGEVLEDFFTESGMDLVRQRLQGFGESDLNRQLWFIRAIAILSTKNPEQETGHDGQISPVSSARISGATPEWVAAQIGEHLCDGAMEDESSVRWLGLQPARQRTYKITLLNENLYSGQAGVTLFLAYLGHLGGDEKYTRLARKSLHTLLQLLQQKSDVTGRLGAFEGLGGIFYLLSHLAALWRQPALLDEALPLLELVQGLVETDNDLDIINGSAGCILGLSSLYRCLPSQAVLDAMWRCGERVVKCVVRTPDGVGWVTTGEAEVPMTGFSHGNAGIAAALLDLAALSGEARFRDLAFDALLYERNLFCAEHGNWPDMRVENNRFAQTNWCHGAPGIGLGRLMILRHEDTPEIREEIDFAVRATLAGGFGRNHSLCHGDLGNMDLLLVANSLLPGLKLEDKIDRLTVRIVEDIERSGWRCGLPLGVETPGLMTGLAGIGYGLLRLAAPGRVPSVLTLEPPINLGIAPFLLNSPTTERSRG